MLGFGKDFPDAKQILLGMNYRSTANIVQNSLKLIENNVERYSKNWKQTVKVVPAFIFRK